MNQNNTLEIRRYLDIVAFKKGQSPPFALHSDALQVAEISDEIWNSMPSTEFSVAEKPEQLNFQNLSAEQDLKDWQNHSTVEPSTEDSRNKFNLTLNITQICNLHCSYCAAGGDGTYGDPVAQLSVEKTLPQIEFFMNRVSSGGEFNITFLGGEPLLYPHALQAIALFTQRLGSEKNLNTGFQIITNATLINSEVLNLLSTFKPTLTVSIDGPAEINDLQRPQKKGGGSTAAALHGLQQLLARKNEFGPVLVHSVFNRLHTNVEKVWDFFRQLPVDKMEFTFDITEKDETANQNFIDSFKSTAQKAFSLGGEKELRRIQFYDIYFEQLDSQIKRKNHCGSGKSLLSLDSRNQVYLCPLEVSHKDRLIGQENNINWGKLKTLEKPLIELNNCSDCWARFLCGGGCMFNHESLTGDKHVKHPTYCLRTRHLLSDVILYYKSSRESE
ncbi:MAG: radical SAM protein [Bdellovibrionales bacterium]